MPVPTDDAWSLYEAIGEGDRSSLSRRQHEVLAICDLRQEVNSGGFDSYFRYWGGDTASIALRALAEALGPEWETLLREAMQVLGPDYPADADARAEVLDARVVDDVLAALDSRFYELEGSSDADRSLNTYLASAP